ncbi:MAG: RidA family protein [Acidimicrobiia bacterium]
MNTPITPGSIAPPAASYELAMLVPAQSELVYTSGIVGNRPDGSIADDIGEQAAEMWRSIGAILAEAGFAPADIVSYTTYAVVGHDLSRVMAARDAFLGDHRAASTLVPVPALARPEWKVEVAVVAARSEATSGRIRA